ncbi:hypothetical protein D3C86_812180 [compost metagenome]
MATAVHLRFEADARLAAHVQRADALGAVGLVRSQAHQVDGQLRDVDVDLAGGLGRVDVEDHALFAAGIAQRDHVLDHADFVVHEEHAGQDGVGADGRLELLEIDEAVFLDVEVGHFEALALEFAHGVEHGLVLGLQGDQVLALALVEVGRALERQVDRLGGARRPDDLTRVGVDQVGHLAARLLDRLFGFPAPGVAARCRVAEMFAQPGNHGVDHTRVDRRGGAVIEIDREMRSDVHGWLGLAWGVVFWDQGKLRAMPAGIAGLIGVRTSRRRCRGRRPNSVRSRGWA